MENIKVISDYRKLELPENLDQNIVARNIPEPPSRMPYGFDVLSFEDLANNQALRISPLMRCIGTIFVLKSRGNSEYAGMIPGFHIPPYGKDPYTYRQIYLDFIKDMEDKYEIKKVIVAGGKINNENNQEFYRIALDNFFLSLPGALASNPEYIQCSPLKDTAETWVQAVKGKIIVIQTTEEGNHYFHKIDY